MYELDNKDIKILNVLCDDARLPYSKIGELTKISKDSVKSRIENLLKEQFVLSFFPFIDYKSFGYDLYHVYLKFGTLVVNHPLFKETVLRNADVVALTRIIGKYDYELQIVAESRFHLYRILDRMLRHVRRNVSELEIIIPSVYHKYTMNIPGLEKSLSTFTYARKQLVSYKPDNDDLRILKVLAKDARQSLVAMSEETGLTPETVRYRLNNLVKAGIIMGFYARTNKHRCGLSTYILLLRVADPIQKQDIVFLCRRRNIYYVNECLWIWNLLIGFSAKDNHELLATLDVVRGYFENRLYNLDLLILLSRYAFTTVPPGMAMKS